VPAAALQSELGKEALSVLLEELEAVCGRLRSAEGAISDLQASQLRPHDACKVGIGMAANRQSHPLAELSSRLDQLGQQVARLQKEGARGIEGAAPPEADVAESSWDVSLTLLSSTDSSTSNPSALVAAQSLSPLGSHRVASAFSKSGPTHPDG